MTFFNKKEDVLDVQLTQLGKYQLSKGTFKPKFYVFSDDEILYDVSYAGGAEEKARDTSNRIQRETQRLKTLYEHDGVESRVLSLNGHVVEKPRGNGWQARVRGRTEEMPFWMAYGNDTIEQEKMGSDDRNLVRNFIGNSSIGETSVPSWDIDSLFEGSIENINISSSSPNVGIKRPVLSFEVDYAVDARYMTQAEIDTARDGLQDNIGPSGELFQYEFDLDSPFARKYTFMDNVVATINNGEVIFSIIESGVDYDIDNFEFEVYEIESVGEVEGTSGAVTEKLRKLSFDQISSLDNSGPFQGSRDNRYVEHYFTVSTDQEIGNEFGFEIAGVNPYKVRDSAKVIFNRVMEAIEAAKSTPLSDSNLEIAQRLAPLSDQTGEECD